jgi:hypothetical protein
MFGQEERSVRQNLTNSSFLKKFQISMGTIKLLSMAVLTILTQKSLRNRFQILFSVKEANIAIQDKKLTNLVAS